MKPLSRIEMKMLIYNKCKRGMTYDQACKQVSMEIAELRKTQAAIKKDKPKPDFKESFTELTRRKKWE